MSADLTDAVLLAERFNWRKAQGVSLKGSTSVQLTGDAVRLEAISFGGDGVDIKGDAEFSRRDGLRIADLEAFKVDGVADVSMKLAKRSDTLDLTITGRYLNAGSIIEHFLLDRQSVLPSEQRDVTAPFDGRIRIDRVDMRAETGIRDLSVDWRRGESGFTDFDLAALDSGKQPLRASLKRTGAGSGPAQIIEIRSDDIGAFLRGVLGVRSINGGQGVVALSASGDETPIAGKLEARALRIANAPLLAKIFAAGSLEGLNDLLNDDGIEIAQTFADFTIEHGGLAIAGARAAGPSVGLTASGFLPLGEGETTLSGAVAPLYQVNSFLGKAPLIGDIFVNRNGEGLLALSYEVTGPRREPRVTVNPLTAFAPGVLRRVFEGMESTDSEPDNATGADAPEQD